MVYFQRFIAQKFIRFDGMKNSYANNIIFCRVVELVCLQKHTNILTLSLSLTFKSKQNKMCILKLEMYTNGIGEILYFRRKQYVSFENNNSNNKNKNKSHEKRIQLKCSFVCLYVSISSTQLNRAIVIALTACCSVFCSTELDNLIMKRI